MMFSSVDSCPSRRPHQRLRTSAREVEIQVCRATWMRSAGKNVFSIPITRRWSHSQFLLLHGSVHRQLGRPDPARPWVPGGSLVSSSRPSADGRAGLIAVIRTWPSSNTNTNVRRGGARWTTAEPARTSLGGVASDDRIRAPRREADRARPMVPAAAVIGPWALGALGSRHPGGRIYEPDLTGTWPSKRLTPAAILLDRAAEPGGRGASSTISHGPSIATCEAISGSRAVDLDDQRRQVDQLSITPACRTRGDKPRRP